MSGFDLLPVLDDAPFDTRFRRARHEGVHIRRRLYRRPEQESKCRRKSSMGLTWNFLRPLTRGQRPVVRALAAGRPCRLLGQGRNDASYARGSAWRTRDSPVALKQGGAGEHDGHFRRYGAHAGGLGRTCRNSRDPHGARRPTPIFKAPMKPPH